MLRYKSDIATIVAMENDCITPLAPQKGCQWFSIKEKILQSLKLTKFVVQFIK